MKDSGVAASSTYDASSQPSNTYTINNHRWNHGTEVLNTMTPTEKEHGKKQKTSSERTELSTLRGPIRQPHRW